MSDAIDPGASEMNYSESYKKISPSKKMIGRVPLLWASSWEPNDWFKQALLTKIPRISQEKV